LFGDDLFQGNGVTAGALSLDGFALIFVPYGHCDETKTLSCARPLFGLKGADRGQAQCFSIALRCLGYLGSCSVSLSCIYKFCGLLFREFARITSARLPTLKGSVCFRTCYAVYRSLIKTETPQSSLLGFSDAFGLLGCWTLLFLDLPSSFGYAAFFVSLAQLSDNSFRSFSAALSFLLLRGFE
jgi:hypothetical protein